MSESTIQRSGEEAAVRGLYQQFMDAWNRGSGADLAAVFTPDGDLVGFDGTHLKGRQVIAAHNQRLFDKWLRGTRLVGHVTDLRFLGPDVAVMHAVGGTVMRGKRAPSRSGTPSRRWSPPEPGAPGSWPHSRTPGCAA
jgi:uncharacterized protein (TIGR02246 family)